MDKCGVSLFTQFLTKKQEHWRTKSKHLDVYASAMRGSAVPKNIGENLKNTCKETFQMCHLQKSNSSGSYQT